MLAPNAGCANSVPPSLSSRPRRSPPDLFPSSSPALVAFSGRGEGGENMIIRSGSCLCGKVQYSVKDAPVRIGLCHCADCRKESGSSFVTFGIWPRHAFESTGEVKYFQGRGFCPECG